MVYWNRRSAIMVFPSWFLYSIAYWQKRSTIMYVLLKRKISNYGIPCMISLFYRLLTKTFNDYHNHNDHVAYRNRRSANIIFNSWFLYSIAYWQKRSTIIITTTTMWPTETEDQQISYSTHDFSILSPTDKNVQRLS